MTSPQPSRDTLAIGLLLAVCAVGACDTGSSVTPLPAPSSDGGPVDEGTSQYTVGRSNFGVTYRLDALTRTSEALGFTVPIGARLVPEVSDGDQVAAQASIGTIEAEPATAAGLAADAERGTVGRSRLVALEAGVGPVSSPVSGSVRDTGAGLEVVHPGIDVTVNLSPLQELRFRGLRFSGTASVETIVGQRSVPCQALWLEDSVADPESRELSESLLRCRLPDGTETAAGLPAVLVLESEPLPGVTTVPATLVSTDDSGENYVVHVQGESRLVPVVVGPTDGVTRVVLEGVQEGDVLTPPSGTTS